MPPRRACLDTTPNTLRPTVPPLSPRQVDPSQIMDLDDMAILEEITQEFGLAAGAGPAGPAVAPAARGPSSLGPYPSAASADTALPPYMASAPPPFAAQQAQQLPGGFSFPPQGSSSLPDLLDATSARSAFNYEPTVRACWLLPAGCWP